MVCVCVCVCVCIIQGNTAENYGGGAYIDVSADSCMYCFTCTCTPEALHAYERLTLYGASEAVNCTLAYVE